jgi:DNA-binding SARP family transcriptional activator
MRTPRNGSIPVAGAGRRGSDSPSATPRLALVGGFELLLHGRPVPLPERAQRLVAFLALRGRPVERQQLAGILWLDSPEGRAMANLRSTIWRIRDVAASMFVEVGRQLLIDPRLVVDVREMTDGAHRILDGAEPDGALVAKMSEAGELLPDWDEEWVLVERERLHQLRLHALELLCERLSADGRFGWAVEACLAAVSAEPLRESAHRALIRAYLAEGNRGDAIAHYRAYRRLLQDELGLEPSSQMNDLVQAVAGR